MPKEDVQLEAISLMRFMPAGAANIGEKVTRQDMRDAGVGTWSATSVRSDNLRTAEEREAAAKEAAAKRDNPQAMADYDEVLPAESADDIGDGPVMRLRFSGS